MTDEKRPNYVHCAQMDLWDGKDPPSPTHKTWCGRVVPPSMEFQFTSANHAALNGLKGGHAMLCTACGAAIRDAIKASTYRPRSKPAAPKAS